MRLPSLIFLLFYLLSTKGLFAQGIAISSDASLPDSSSMLDIKSTQRGLLIPRMTLNQRDSIILPAKGLLVFQINHLEGFYYYDGSNWVNVSGNNAGSYHHIGELFEGGIVFWVDETGKHGLICSLVDLSSGQIWSNIYNVLIGLSAQSDWDGLQNTLAIIQQTGQTTSAAKLCDDYVNDDYGTGVFSDWYLPAIDELSLVFQEKYIIDKTLENDHNNLTNGLAKTFYWSSTEAYFSTAWLHDIYSGTTYDDSKYYMNSVRAVRNF